MNRKSLRYGLSAATACALALTSACGGSTRGSGGTSSATGPVVLGASLSLTGSLGQFGVDLKAGYEQKVNEINAAGGLSVGGVKRQVSLVVLDNRSDPATATSQIRELALKDNATALLGACTPPIVIPEALAAEQQKIPYVSSCNPVLAFAAGSTGAWHYAWHYAWDLFFSENDQAADVMKVLATVPGAKRIAIFTDTEPDGVAERALYKQQAAAHGLQVVGDYTFPVGTTDFSSFIDQAKSNGAQLVAAQMIPPDGIALWKQMKALGFSPKLAFVAKAAAGKSWTQALGPVAEGTLGDDFWSPATGGPGSAQLADTLGAQFPDDLSDLNIAVLGYTVAAIVTDAVQSAGDTDPAAVNTAIGKTNGQYPLGHVQFGPTHTATTPYLVTQWQNSNTVVVLPAAAGTSLEMPGKGLQ